MPCVASVAVLDEPEMTRDGALENSGEELPLVETVENPLQWFRDMHLSASCPVRHELSERLRPSTRPYRQPASRPSGPCRPISLSRSEPRTFWLKGDRTPHACLRSLVELSITPYRTRASMGSSREALRAG